MPDKATASGPPAVVASGLTVLVNGASVSKMESFAKLVGNCPATCNRCDLMASTMRTLICSNAATGVAIGTNRSSAMSPAARAIRSRRAAPRSPAGVAPTNRITAHVTAASAPPSTSTLFASSTASLRMNCSSEWPRSPSLNCANSIEPRCAPLHCGVVVCVEVAEVVWVAVAVLVPVDVALVDAVLVAVLVPVVVGVDDADDVPVVV